jgi:hypothetical protein
MSSAPRTELQLVEVEQLACCEPAGDDLAEFLAGIDLILTGIAASL